MAAVAGSGTAGAGLVEASAVLVSGFASPFGSVFGSSFLGSSFFATSVFGSSFFGSSFLATVVVGLDEVDFELDVGLDFFFVDEAVVLLVPPEDLPLVVRLILGAAFVVGFGVGAGGGGSGAGVSFFFTNPEIRLRKPFFSASASSPHATETISVDTTNKPKSRFKADRDVESESFMRRIGVLRDGYRRRG